ncbi:hypothetical protein GW813_07660 [bacterium]|nr:hypothetical protein [bacterium]
MIPPRTIAGEYLEQLAAIHAATDTRAAALAARHAPHLVCRRGCCDCCQDGLTVLEIEAAWIMPHRDRWEDPDAGPHPVGRCAFLDSDGACRIYRWRPFVCRTQGLPLRWLDDAGSAEAGRSICPLNEAEFVAAGRPLVDLDSAQLWTLGETEGRLASLQAEAAGEFAQVRITLRNLFDA